MSPGWVVERPVGSIAERHRSEPSLDDRRVLVHEVEDVAVVVGSGQRVMPVLEEPSVVRRRSGGGAVLVGPGEVLWIDILLPRGDPLWNDDVSRSVGWLGGAWCAALAEINVEATVHHGPMVVTRWSEVVCFAGIGPGEVLVGGRKVVGISQRRNRGGARFQCAALLRWRPGEMVRLFGLQPEEAVSADLQGVAVGLGVDAGELAEALLGQLP
ncbi:MAG: hypothetical protein CL505_04880 [Actinobacteria bacterium]|jgi:lipoate-protein ligase A|nr:hypothetical protein [Actinomycetota bacterium]MDP6061621.1 hypothetical protein [Acidimicrobiales bacterium]|tara:strand:+ start:15884 stop:16522 length:639 start_codon:yes stop_codon:yes gene_type:complete